MEVRLHSTVRPKPKSQASWLYTNTSHKTKDVLFSGATAKNPEKQKLIQHVEELTKLSKSGGDTLAYIREQWQSLGLTVEEQPFTVEGEPYKNLMVSFGPSDAERIIIGTHYDSTPAEKRKRVLPAANYIASGVAGLLEVSRLLKESHLKLDKRIDLIAYANDEPPYWRMKYKSSQVHAEHLQSQNVDVGAMVSLDGIGYYSDEENSQNYPLKFITKYFFPTKGNFIAILGNLKARPLIQKLKAAFAEHANIDVKTMAAPSFIRGMDFSDHRHFARNGVQAVMVSDTGFMRNTKHYNSPTDTIETLNFDKMTEVVKGMWGFLNNL